MWASDLIALGLKALIDRPRPPDAIPGLHALMEPMGSSLPSGHAATSAAGLAVLALATPRRYTPALALLAIAICFSRVYVGVHYPTDVLAGAALGGAVALLVRALRSPGTARTRRRRGRSPG